MEIYVDQITPGMPPSSSFGTIRHDARQRQDVLEIAQAFTQGWSRGNTKVVEMKAWRGIRGMWLSCAEPGYFGEEFARFIVIEDDIELSAVWLVIAQSNLNN